MVRIKKSDQELHEHFRRNFYRRLHNVFNDIETLSRCSDPRYYKYSSNEIEESFEKLDKRLKDVKIMFLKNLES